MKCIICEHTNGSVYAIYGGIEYKVNFLTSFAELKCKILVMKHCELLHRPAVYWIFRQSRVSASIDCDCYSSLWYFILALRKLANLLNWCTLCTCTHSDTSNGRRNSSRTHINPHTWHATMWSFVCELPLCMATCRQRFHKIKWPNQINATSCIFSMLIHWKFTSLSVRVRGREGEGDKGAQTMNNAISFFDGSKGMSWISEVNRLEVALHCIVLQPWTMHMHNMHIPMNWRLKIEDSVFSVELQFQVCLD